MTQLARYYMDGPGEVLIMDASYSAATPGTGNIIAVVTAKNSSFRSTVQEEKVTGGRAIFPKRKFITSRENVLELEDCEMDFRYLSLTQGSSISTASVAAWAYGDNYKKEIIAYTADNTAGFELHDTPVDGTLVIKTGTGVVFNAVTASASLTTSTATPTYMLSGKKVLVSPAADVWVTTIPTSVRPIYQYTSTTSSSVTTTASSVPKTVKVILTQTAFSNDNEILGYHQIEMYKAQAGGEFEQAFAENTAFSPKLTFELLDPQRADGKLVEYRFIPVT